MKRTKEAELKPRTNRIKWINQGGPFRTKNKHVVKNGETFEASPDEVPMAFRGTIKPIDPIALQSVVDEEPKAIVPTYSMKQRGSSSFYDIFSSQGKKLNDKDLTQEEAQDLLVKMSAGTVEG